MFPRSCTRQSRGAAAGDAQPTRSESSFGWLAGGRKGEEGWFREVTCWPSSGAGGSSWGEHCTEAGSRGSAWPDDTDGNTSSEEAFSVTLEGAHGLCVGEAGELRAVSLTAGMVPNTCSALHQYSSVNASDQACT